MPINILRALFARRDGSVSVVSAIALPILVAMTGMVAEYGNGLLHKVEDQRIADAAAFAAATSFNANSGNSLTSVVDSVASLNGIPTSDISATLTTSPSGDGNQAVLVSVSTQSPLLLSRVLGNGQANLTVTATSYAEMKGGAPGCIIALSSSGLGVTLSGGTSVSAPACAVASDNAVSVPCGTSITTVAVNYDSASAPSEPCTGIQAPSGKTLQIKKSTTADPLAGNSEVAAATARLTTVTSLTSPNAPTVPTEAAINFGALSLGGGVTLAFNTGGSASAVYNFASINDSGAAMHFGPGTYNIAGGVQTGGGSTTTFAGGAFNIGAGTFSCNGSSGYSICNTGTTLTDRKSVV